MSLDENKRLESARSRYGAVLLFALVTITGCTHLPRDPEKTLDHVQQKHIIRVGVVESPPWIVRNGGEPAGIEVNLVRKFAQSVSATPQWFWDSDERHMEALQHYQLDVVVANLDSKTPWEKKVGITPPYFDERRALSPGLPSRPMERKHVMAVPPGENEWLQRLGDFLQQHKSEVRTMLQQVGANS